MKDNLNRWTTREVHLLSILNVVNEMKRLNFFILLNFNCAVLCLVAQSCPTLWDSRDCSLPGSSVHGDSPAKNTGVGCHALFQGIFPSQGSNPLCRRTLHHLNHQGSPLVFLFGIKHQESFLLYYCFPSSSLNFCHPRRCEPPCCILR